VAYWNSIPRGIIYWTANRNRGNCLHAGLVNIPRESKKPEFRNYRGFISFERGIADSCAYVCMYVQYLATFAWRREFTTDRCQTIAVAVELFVLCDLKISIKPTLITRDRKISETCFINIYFTLQYCMQVLRNFYWRWRKKLTEKNCQRKVCNSVLSVTTVTVK